MGGVKRETDRPGERDRQIRQTDSFNRQTDTGTDRHGG